MKIKKLMAVALSLSLLAGNLSFAGRPIEAMAAPVHSETEDGLVLYASFDEEHVSNGTVSDLSGNDNHGTVTGAIQFVDGISGKAAYINNTGSAMGSDSNPAEQSINFGKQSSLQFGTGDFSVSLWMKTEKNGSSNSAVLSNKNYSNGSNVGFAVGNFSQDVRMNFSALSDSRIELTKIYANNDTWHHVVSNFDRDGNMTVYVDGKKHSSASMTSQAGKSANTGLDLILGAGGNGKNGIGRCTVDELRVYNKVLTEDRVSELYEEGLVSAGLEKILSDGLVMHSDFEESSVTGNVVADLTGRGNNGQITGNLTFEDGVKGRAVSIDNAGAAGKSQPATQFINYGQPADLKFGTGDFSLAFWLKTTGNGSNNGTIISNKDYNSGSNVGWAMGNFNNPNDKDVRVNLSSTGNSRVEIKKVKINDDEWHHVTAAFRRNGLMTVYVDGKPFSTLEMKAHNLTVDTGLDFVLGADGKKMLGMSGCTVDELRVYKNAIGDSMAELLYLSEGAGLTMEKMERQLDGMTPNSMYTEESIQEMKDKVTLAKQQLLQATADETVAIVKTLEKEYNRFLEGEDPLMNFQVVSDVHISSSNLGDTNAVNFIAGLQDMQAIAPDSAGFVTIGDNTQSGTEAQYNGFYNILNQYLPVDASEAMIALGNHDVRGSNSADWNRDPAVVSPYWPTAYQLYMTKNAAYMPDTSGKVYYDRWLGGYHFIVLNTENGLKDASQLSQEQIDWFREKVAENAETDKPIFVFVHQALNDTHWRSNILNGFGNEDGKVKEIMAEYPQIILMSGHIHNGFGVAEAVDRPFGTVVEVPSYNESENGYKERGIGYHVKVYDDSVVFKARNFKTSTWLPQYDITVDLPGLPAVYRQAKALDPERYTLESWAGVEALTTQIEEIFDRKYDQSGLTWDNVAPPPTSYFGPETRSSINRLNGQLTAALGALEEEAVAELYPTQDLYLQAGTDAGKTPTSYSNYNANSLRVKTSDSRDQTYTRKTLLTFDLSGLEAGKKDARLVLQLAADPQPNPGPHLTEALVYKVNPDWLQSVTWNTSPQRIGTKPVAKILPSSVEGTMVTVDLSDAVTTALENGETSLSLEISVAAEANNNMIDFYSSRAAGKQKPTLTVQNRREKPVNPTFQALREKWLANLLGGELDTSNEAVQTYVTNTDNKAWEYWNTMIKSSQTGRTSLWQDLDISYVAGTGNTAKEHSGNISETFYRLRDIAIAYATEGCRLYQDEEVKRELIAALDHINENYYTDSDSKTPVFGNWWHWEIGSPIAFLNTAMILYDDLTERQIGSYVSAVNRFTNVCDRPSGYPGSPAMTGANLIDKGMAVVLAGLLTDNEQKLNHVKSAYKTVFTYVESGDGFYEDGSFIQHQALAYMGGYGSQLYEKLGILFSVMKGSEWELTYDDGAEQLIFDMIFDGIEPFLYDGLMMDMVSGRDITRSTAVDKKRGVKILDAIMLMGDAMPTEAEKEKFRSMVKYYIGLDEDYFYNNCTYISSMMKANEIMKDESVAPRSDYALHKLFAGMDKLVHTVPGENGYSLGLSMHSSRTYGHELINDEGKKTWNISDGMTYFYTKDRNQYGEGYWATVDPKRLSGTTAENTNRPNGAGDRMYNVYNWVGGSSLGLYGTAGMRIKTLGSGTAKNGADVKKSWFTFDDEVVAVGSGITSSTGNKVETIVDNRKIKQDGSNRIIINGSEANIASGETTLTDSSWIVLEGNVPGADMGYYFPEPANMKAVKELRTGNWSSQGTTTGEASNYFTTFWFDHGANPTDASYSYVVLPNKSAGEMEDYANAPDIEILENTVRVHAVRENSLGITAVNFWNNESTTAAGITSDKAASLTMKEDGDTVTLGVADPTQENRTTIELSLAMAAEQIDSKDENITVLQTEPFVKLSVSVSGTKGKTSEITFTKKEVTQREVVSLLDTLETVQVPEGVAFADLPLPTQVRVLDNTMQTVTVDVSWDRGDYSKTGYGSYTLTGTLVMPEGLSNSLGLTAAIEVQVGAERALTVSDTYVQGGTDADRPSREYAIRGNLILKNDRGAQNYTRKSILKFDLSNVPEEYTGLYLTFQLTGRPSADFTTADIYQVDSEWSEDAITFSNFPVRISEEPVARMTKAMTDAELVQKIDVADVVEAARAAGQTEISFELSIPEAAGNNYVGIHSLESTAEDALKPALVWEAETTTERITKANLSFAVDMAADLDLSQFKNANRARIDRLIETGRQILADPDAAQTQIREIERLITRELSGLRRK